jgi:uncharacterized membrane protein
MSKNNLRYKIPNQQKYQPNNLTVPAQSQQIIQQYSGPLPPPNFLEQYDKVCPGAAQKIIDMTVNQSAHRIELEKQVIASNIKESARGQLFAFIIVLCLIFVGALFVVLGKTNVGLTIFGTTIVATASVFVYGKKAQKEQKK